MKIFNYRNTTISLIGLIVLSYSACSRFQTLDSTVAVESHSTNSDSQDNSGQNMMPMPSPMPQQVPSPMPQQTMPSPSPQGPTQVHSKWTNEPAGFKPVFETDFSTLNGLDDVYKSTVLTTDPSAPFSPNKVAMHRLEAGAKNGGGQIGWYTQSPQREMFVGLYWRVNSGWEGRTVQDKLFFMRGDNSNGLFEWIGGPRKGGPMILIWAHNSGNVDNSHICGGPAGLGSGGNCFPNVSTGAVGAPGTWHKIEAYVKTSTTLTSRDGEVKWWINGQLAGAYTKVNYGSADKGINYWAWTETWDGSGDMGKSNTVPWEHYIDHLYISMKN